MGIKYEIVIAAENKANKAFQDVDNQAKSLAQKLGSVFGEQSGLGVFGKLLAGGGIVAGLAAAGKALADMSSKAVELRDKLNAGEISAGEMTQEFAKSIPILGSIVTLGTNINELVTGDKAALAAANRELKEGNVFLNARLGLAKLGNEQHERTVALLKKIHDEERLITLSTLERSREQVRMQARTDIAAAKAEGVARAAAAEKQFADNLPGMRQRAAEAWTLARADDWDAQNEQLEDHTARKGRETKLAQQADAAIVEAMRQKNAAVEQAGKDARDTEAAIRRRGGGELVRLREEYERQRDQRVREAEEKLIDEQVAERAERLRQAGRGRDADVLTLERQRDREIAELDRDEQKQLGEIEPSDTAQRDRVRGAYEQRRQAARSAFGRGAGRAQTEADRETRERMDIPSSDDLRLFLDTLRSVPRDRSKDNDGLRSDAAFGPNGKALKVLEEVAANTRGTIILRTANLREGQA